ncbi:gamma-glutamylcyclotransferase family protein [Streptomyces salyersiae]|uniref:Putative gamma-glutamylcyclotransferase n=1 Tax=Streptomyces salyersiae TaxID=3075530 RepID=A0ABU2RNB5_9ACTN|nr:gamma-glutamylcyclotransferase family protein [Streptomyces sp. DSM 41770]MDT0430343.1 gamma-glutamylcyclotransferase family protein [Streptomyces sp. DSM 41770]
MYQATAQPSPVTATSGSRCRLSPDAATLFAYGTLQFDAVLEGLIGRIPQQVSASAPGWRAASLEGRVYPGLVAAPGSVAPGVLFTDLSRREWAILDAFEDDRYDLREVTLSSGGRGLAYIWPAGEVLDEDWNSEQFRTRHLEEYAARCARIAPGLLTRAAH